jgi:hypothetical protein
MELNMRVADLTIEELRQIIKEIIDEKFRELLFDPDEGLELKEEIEQRLRASLLSTERIPFEEVKKRKVSRDV